MAGACVLAGVGSWLDPELLVVWIVAIVLWSVAVFAIRGPTEVLIAGIVILLLIAIDAAVSFASTQRRARSDCQGRLRQIALALQCYHDVYKSFPPAYVADETGKPMHSWRVLILPFLEQKALYDQYRFDEPWDGPNNGKLAVTT